MNLLRKSMAMVLALVMVLSCTALSAAAVREPDAGNIPADRTSPLSALRQEGAKLPRACPDDTVVRAMVVLDGAPEAAFSQYSTQQLAQKREDLLTQHQLVQNRAAELNCTPLHDYTSLLNAFSAEIPYGQLDALRAVNGVASVHVVNTYSVPETEQSELLTAGSGLVTGNAQMARMGYNGAGTVVAVLDTGLNTTHEAFRDADGLCAEHAALLADCVELTGVGGTYLSPKVPYAYDYADQDRDVTDAQGHGTHVSGISVGYCVDESEGAVTFQGAAPAAQLLAMKIFHDAQPSTSDDIIFQALEDAYLLHADVVNLSLGSPNGFVFDDTMITQLYGEIFTRLDNAGVIVSVSAGNSGSMAEGAHRPLGSDYTDIGTVGRPATYPGNLSVAASENLGYPAYCLTVDGQNFSYVDSAAQDDAAEYDWLANFGGQDLPFVVVKDADGNMSMGDRSDYANVDVTDKIAVVQRGLLTFSQKHMNAAIAGAAGLVVCNNQPGEFGMKIDFYLIPSVAVPVEMQQAFLNSESGLLTTGKEPEYMESALANQMSAFSSWGTSPSLTIAPAITSVGGNVYSSVNGADDAYAVYNGTSMSAPNVAGTAANLISYLEASGFEGTRAQRAALVESLLESSAQVLTDENGTAYQVRRQGAGLAQIVDAVRCYENAGYLVNPLAELGDDPNKMGEYTFDVTLKNTTDQIVVYRDFEAVILTDELSDLDIAPEEGQPARLFQTGMSHQLNTQAEQFRVSDQDEVLETLTLEPYAEKTVTVTVTLDEASRAYLDQFENGAFVEGYVSFHTSGRRFSQSFTDCKEAWYQDAVDYAAANGLMIGTGDEIFEPLRSMDRAMLITVLYRNAGSPAVDGASSFTDVPADAYFADAAAWAEANAIVQGVGGGKFAPFRQITRQELAVILWRCAGSPAAEANLEDFQDTDRIDDYALEAMKWASAQKILIGYEGMLNPAGKANRAEAALMLMRYLGGPDRFTSHATFLAYYGSWSAAPMLETEDFRDLLDIRYQLTQIKDESGSSLAELGYVPEDFMDFVTVPNLGFAYNVEEDTPAAFLGDNFLDDATDFMGEPYLDTVPYRPEYAAFSTPEYILSDCTEGDELFSSTDSMAVLPSLLRNARHLVMTVTDRDTGEVYFVDDTEYLPKGTFDPVESMWQAYGMFLWDGTDEMGDYVPSGTTATVTFTGMLSDSESAYSDGTPAPDVWTFDVTVDSQAPVIENVVYDDENHTLTVTASDAEYLQGIYLYDEWGVDFEYSAAFAPETKGESCTVTFDVTEYEQSGSVKVGAADYALNEVCREVYLFETGKPATITLISAEGTQTIEAVTGDVLSFPDRADIGRDYSFDSWVTKEYETLTEDDYLWTDVFHVDEPLLVKGDQTFYGLYIAWGYTPYDVPLYTMRKQDVTGQLALVGYPYDAEADKGDSMKPMALGQNGETVALAERQDVSGFTGRDFNSEATEFAFEAVPVENGLAFRNVVSGKYLAYEGTEVIMADTVTPEAVWTVSGSQWGYNSVFCSASNPDMILGFDDVAHTFRMFDNTVPVGQWEDGTEYFPEEWYLIYTYYRTTEDLYIDYLTTQVPKA